MQLDLYIHYKKALNKLGLISNGGNAGNEFKHIY